MDEKCLKRIRKVVRITYRITKILDKNGNSKDDFFAGMKACHPNMSGEILYPELIRVGGCFRFLWNDTSGKVLTTSIIEEYENDYGKVKVVTRNSVYYLEEIK